MSLKRHKKIHHFRPVSDLYTNPIDRLQPLSQIPLITESEQVFCPSRPEIEEASQMFEHMNIKGQRFEFLGSWPNPHIMPKWNEPEESIILSLCILKSLFSEKSVTGACLVFYIVMKKMEETRFKAILA